MQNIIFIIILGAVVGSFLNLCIHRLPRSESIIFPASHCPKCGHRLGFLDLVPILGYFLLRGRCRYCKAPISFRYPFVEILTVFLFAMVYLRSSHPLDQFFLLIFSALLILIFFVDLEHQVIPDAAVYPGIACGLLYNFARGTNALVLALAGTVLGYILFWLIAKLGKWWFKKEAMGEGDLFLAALLGAFLGAQLLLVALFLTYVIAGIFSLFLLVSGRVRFGEYIPFGPYLVAGAFCALFFGERILNWYLMRLTW